jgi:hypothetical protein
MKITFKTTMTPIIKNSGRLACIIGAAALSACASSPKSIAPQYVSTFQYAGLTCNQLNLEMERAQNALAMASKAQSSARASDLLSIALLGMPTSTLSGANQAPYIGKLKGDVEAMMRANTQKNCETQVVNFDTSADKTLMVKSAESIIGAMKQGLAAE